MLFAVLAHLGHLCRKLLIVKGWNRRRRRSSNVFLTSAAIGKPVCGSPDLRTKLLPVENEPFRFLAGAGIFHGRRDGRMGGLKKRLRIHPHPLPTTQVMGLHGWLAEGKMVFKTVNGDARM